MEEDLNDNKYFKIERETTKVRRTVTILALLSFLGLGIFSSYANDNTNNKSSIRRIAQEEELPPNTVQTEEIIENTVNVINDGPSEEELLEEFNKLDREVRKIKATGVIMEADKHSLEVTAKFQQAARALLVKKYGNPPYRVQMDLEFQGASINHSNRYDTLLIEMAPIDLIPYSVFNFLEMARGYKSGGFHRNAGHVLQAAVQSSSIKRPLAFQEYSPSFPHVKGTVGYCGRPSSVCWYVSLMDNTQNHGPGSQQKHNPYEADANFGEVIKGMEVVSRAHNTMKRNQFLNDKKDWVLVNAMHILVTDSDGTFYEWQPKH